MRRRILAILTCIAFLFSSSSFAQDRDVTSRDLKGVPKGHRYFWAIVGGTAVGMGIGVIAPGGSKSAFKGALIGGSAASAFYLIKNPRAAAGEREWAHVITNTLLFSGVFWTVCNCGTGAWSGALIGGGGTAVIQAFGTHNRTMAKMSGTANSTPPSTPVIPSAPGGTTTPVVAGQTQDAPAQPQSQPAQAQPPAAQVQIAPVQTQNNPVQTTAPAAQTQSAPASTQGDPPGTQAAPAGTQNPPIENEDLIFSSSSNDNNGNNRISSVAPQTAPTKPQNQRP
jgi:hypothetical protein